MLSAVWVGCGIVIDVGIVTYLLALHRGACGYAEPARHDVCRGLAAPLQGLVMPLIAFMVTQTP